MKYVVDKETIAKVKDFSKNEYIYAFDNEPLEELLKLNLHCIHKDYIETIPDLKNPFKRDYRFAIIVPNYNNDHR